VLRSARLGNEHFRHFDIRQATAITFGGQLVIRFAEQEINKVMNALLDTNGKDYVIASDTDSLYLKFAGAAEKLLAVNPALTQEQLVEKLDKIAEKKIIPAFDEIFNRLSQMLGAQQGTLVMKREAIANRGIWTAKKRYMLNVFDNEGIRYDTPKIKIMGIEAVKSSTPSSCRKAIKDAIGVIMSGTERDLQEFIKKYRQEFQSLPFEDIAFPRAVNQVTKYLNLEKGVPIHTKGAVIYNRLRKELKLEKKYEEIRNGEKIKFCYLKEPNPIMSHVISAIAFLPEEFGLRPYIDYSMQFDKAFIEPLNAILKVIGWHPEPNQTLESFF